MTSNQIQDRHLPPTFSCYLQRRRNRKKKTKRRRNHCHINNKALFYRKSHSSFIGSLNFFSSLILSFFSDLSNIRIKELICTILVSQLNCFHSNYFSYYITIRSCHFMAYFNNKHDQMTANTTFLNPYISLYSEKR